jgi:hypothetical protein
MIRLTSYKKTGQDHSNTERAMEHRGTHHLQTNNPIDFPLIPSQRECMRQTTASSTLEGIRPVPIEIFLVGPEMIF